MLKLKQPIRLYCPKCGYERIITDPIDAIAITESSYKLARKGKEPTCPKCGYPIASEPCILYPGGWSVLSKLIEEESSEEEKFLAILGVLIIANLLIKKT